MTPWNTSNLDGVGHVSVVAFVLFWFVFFMSFSTKVMLCSCTEGTPKERDRIERKKRVELGRTKDSFSSLFGTTPTSLAGKGQHLSAELFPAGGRGLVCRAPMLTG